MTLPIRSSARVAVALIVCTAAAHVAEGRASRAEAATEGTVKVTAKYTGKGEVDASHRLWIWLFDSPNIGPGAMPIAELSLDTNGGTATFADLAASTVWIAVAYDEKGGFAGMAPPPSGSPVALYIDSSGPAAVTPGAKTEVTVAFDDSQRMP